MENILKTIAGIFAILFIVTTVLAFVLFSVEQSAFDPELYIQALDDEGTYQRLPELTAQALAIAAQRPNANQILSLFRNLSGEEWRVFVTELFPPDVLRTLAVDGVTQVLDYLNGGRDTVTLSLASLKINLLSPEGVSAVYGMLKAQPDCSVEQLTAMALNQSELTLCSPPETFLFFDLRPVIESQIQGAMSLLPEQVTIIKADANRTQTLRDLRALRLFMRWSPLMPLLCLLLMTALAVRSIRDWLNWWGYPLLIAGLLSMTLSAMSGIIASLTFQVFIAAALPDAIPPEIVSVFKDISATIVRKAVQPTLPLAGLMALIGLIMILVAFLFRKRFQKTPAYAR
jgi:hypothetical protein